MVLLTQAGRQVRSEVLACAVPLVLPGREAAFADRFSAHPD